MCDSHEFTNLKFNSKLSGSYEFNLHQKYIYWASLFKLNMDII